MHFPRLLFENCLGLPLLWFICFCLGFFHGWLAGWLAASRAPSGIEKQAGQKTFKKLKYMKISRFFRWHHKRWCLLYGSSSPDGALSSVSLAGPRFCCATGHHKNMLWPDELWSPSPPKKRGTVSHYSRKWLHGAGVWLRNHAFMLPAFLADVGVQWFCGWAVILDPGLA